MKAWMLGLAMSAMLAGNAMADTTIGQWCDTAWPDGGNQITITRNDAGAHRVTNQFAQGGVVAHRLRVSNGAYYAIGEDFGQYYRINGDGTLRLFDNDGFIRSARPGRCRR